MNVHQQHRVLTKIANDHGFTYHANPRGIQHDTGTMQKPVSHGVLTLWKGADGWTRATLRDGRYQDHTFHPKLADALRDMPVATSGYLNRPLRTLAQFDAERAAE
jgi:hypothetical protein